MSLVSLDKLMGEAKRVAEPIHQSVLPIYSQPFENLCPSVQKLRVCYSKKLNSFGSCLYPILNVNCRFWRCIYLFWKNDITGKQIVVTTVEHLIFRNYFSYAWSYTYMGNQVWKCFALWGLGGSYACNHSPVSREVVSNSWICDP